MPPELDIQLVYMQNAKEDVYSVVALTQTKQKQTNIKIGICAKYHWLSC